MSDVADATATDPDAIQSQSRRTLWIIVGVVVVAIAIAAIWWLSDNVAVPDVTGVPQEQATADLEAAGLAAGDTSVEPTLAVAPGTVVGQTPGPDTTVRSGSKVDLIVAAIPTAAVPEVIGMVRSEAEGELAVAGLRVGDVTTVPSDDPRDTVLAQSPEADEEVDIASTVALEISAGPVAETPPAEAPAETPPAETPPAETPPAETPPAETPPVVEPTPPEERPEPGPSLTEVPDLIGMRVLEALSALRKADLQFAIAWGPADQDYLRIVEQDPAAGQSVDSGSVVTITIGLPSFLFDGVEIQPLPTEPGDGSGDSGSSSESATSAP